jgi:hypothetical protein
MSSGNYTNLENNYTLKGNGILLLKAAIFDAQEMMENAASEREGRWFKHAIRVLRYELRYQRKMFDSKEGGTRDVFVQN